MLSENVILPSCNNWPQYVGRGPGWMAWGKVQYCPPCGLAVEAPSTLRTERQCVCIRCPGLSCFLSEDFILWFATSYHENFLCHLDLVKQHISSLSVFSQPCPAQPWAPDESGPPVGGHPSPALPRPHLRCLMAGAGAIPIHPAPLRGSRTGLVREALPSQRGTMMGPSSPSLRQRPAGAVPWQHLR